MLRFLLPFLLLSSLFLKGCSFRPLLKENSSAQSKIPFIKIAPIKDRGGQRLHNTLLTLLTPEGPPKKPLYELKIAFSSSQAGEIFSRSKVATRRSAKTRAVAKLLSLETKKTVWSQSFATQSAYSLKREQGKSAFANYIAGQKSTDRTIDLIAYDIHTHLAAFFEELSIQKEKVESEEVEFEKLSKES
ncbi:MAG: hypothetical protein GY915_09770 [bacterium]|nr:hypothetical protein [bacterium]